MKFIVNSSTGVEECLLPAVIVSINETIKTSKNVNKSEYKSCIVNTTYPDGTVEEMASKFYVNAQIALPEVYRVGANVVVAIQMDGEGAGLSTVGAPEIKRANLDLINKYRVTAEA
jgi:hypothetical protein